MTRRKMLDCNYELPFHVGARCINRDWFALPLPQVWGLMQRQLYFLVHAFDVGILGFVLMNNHFHLLAVFKKGNISEAMAYFLRETSRELRFASDRINHTYSSRFFRSYVGGSHYYLQCYKYLYRNPVEAGIADRVQDYPWSTLRGLLGFEHLLIPMLEDHTLMENVEGTLSWLNRPPEPGHWQAVRKAIRKRNFRFGKDRNTREPHVLEYKLL